MNSFNDFIDQFKFDPGKAGNIGSEREFLLLRDEKIVPIAVDVLKGINSTNGTFGYELSACQLESRTNPCSLELFPKELQRVEDLLVVAEKNIGFRRSFKEVGPRTMPRDIYPNERYVEIASHKSVEELLAACRVVATHIHVGMPNHETALIAYNKTLQYVERLCELGDHSGGKRLAIYRKMASNCTPPNYDTWRDFYAKAVTEGFTNDPRQCWTWVRISKHGTIEFRMFGTTNKLSEIVKWAQICHKICFS